VAGFVHSSEQDVGNSQRHESWDKNRE
jgi:hypothetical protein